MIHLKEERHRLSNDYDIAANDLDESIVPILIVMDKMSKELSNSLEKSAAQSKIIEQLLNKKVPQIYCDKPKTALLVGIGKYGSIALAISMSFCTFWTGVVMLKTNEVRYSHLENLSKVVKYDEKSGIYFIEKKHYKKVKNGITLLKQ
jgi:hypothetical protein